MEQFYDIILRKYFYWTYADETKIPLIMRNLELFRLYYKISRCSTKVLAFSDGCQKNTHVIK